MKKLFITLLLLLSIGINTHSQNITPKDKYSQKYKIMDECDGCDCRKAIWRSEYGGHYANVWDGTQWTYVWKNGVYYWFYWISYDRCDCH